MLLPAQEFQSEDLCNGMQTCRLLVTNMTINDIKSLARDGVCMKELQPGAFRSEVGIYIPFLRTCSGIPNC